VYGPTRTISLFMYNHLKNRYDLRCVTILTFSGPCTVIYSYKKNEREAPISQICFWNRTQHVSDSISVHHQESSTVHTAIGICHTGYADCLLASFMDTAVMNPKSRVVLNKVLERIFLRKRTENEKTTQNVT